MNQLRPPSSVLRHPGAGDASSGESAADPPAGSGLAGSVWELMSGFVRSHDPSDELRHTLGLGRGTGRVKALINLGAGAPSPAPSAKEKGGEPDRGGAQGRAESAGHRRPPPVPASRPAPSRPPPAAGDPWS